MTLPIAFVLGLLGLALVLFVTERIKPDLVALLVLVALAVAGLVSPAEALAGFSNPATVTVWAMFILSAGLTQTGVAAILGRFLLRWTGRSEARAAALIMLAAGVLSAFMNNIGVAALMLPVVMHVARSTGRAPSRLLMPLAFGSLLGGLTTLIGTPPNLLVSESLRQRGLEPFGMFDFVPVGGAVMVGGTAFVALAGLGLLPRRDPGRETSAFSSEELRRQYALDERSAVLRVPRASLLAGRTLRNSRLGSAAGLNVYAVLRDGRTDLAPDPDTVLREGDRLLVEGKLDRLEELQAWRELEVERSELRLEELVAADVAMAEIEIRPGAGLAGRTLASADVRKRLGVIVLALRRKGAALHGGLASTPLQEQDRLLVQGRREDLERLSAEEGLEVTTAEPSETLSDGYGLRQRLFAVRLPEESSLAGRNLAETRLGDALGLGVLGIVRDKRTILLPSADEGLVGRDRLLVRGDPGDLAIFRGLQSLELESEARPGQAALESEGVGLVEAMLSPRSPLAGRTLREIAFRDRYGLQVLAILRAGRAHRSNLRDMDLRLGDALLLLGSRARLDLLARDRDFLVLGPEAPEAAPDTARAPVAVAILGAVVATAVLGFLPISVASVAGTALMVLTGCLNMEAAYRAIDWRSVFLIAGMLPLGTAMESTGAASLLASQVVGTFGGWGPWAVLVGLYLFTALLTCVVPTAALVVLMAPIILDAAAGLGASPHSMMMAVAMAASGSFTSPISHPANLLVMGPGGYRFADYVKLGVPLTLVVLVIVLVVLPWTWPLVP